MIEGLLELYQTTFNEKWFVAARELADTMLQHYADPAGGFFDTSDDHEMLVTRPKDLQDNAVPSGNAMATQLLLRLHHITGRDEYRERAEKVLRAYYDAMESQPFGFAHLICALDFYLAKPKEIFVIGDRQSPGTREILAGIHSLYLPNMTLQLATPDEPLEKIAPLLSIELRA